MPHVQTISQGGGKSHYIWKKCMIPILLSFWHPNHRQFPERLIWVGFYVMDKLELGKLSCVRTGLVLDITLSCHY